MNDEAVYRTAPDTLGLLISKFIEINRKKEFEGSGGYTTRIRRLYNKEQEVMFSDAIIEPLQTTLAYIFFFLFFFFFFFVANFASLAGFFWYPCYYPHRSRYALCPVCGIFKASALWTDAFIEWRCQSIVYISVHL